MADDLMCVRQPPYVPVAVPSHPPADDSAVTQGGAGHNTPPQPAAHQPKLLMPGQAKDAKAAEDQAKKASRGFEDASANIAKLLSKHANPKEISKAERALYIAQGKAEFAAWHNLNVQRELKAQRSVILQQAEDEQARAEVDVRDNPSPSTHATLDAAYDRLRQALDPYGESCASVGRAEELQDWVTNVTEPFTPLTADVATKYPTLAAAKDAFYRALEQLSSFEHKNDSREVVKQHLKQAQEAAVELRTAWDDARKDSDPLIRGDCDRGFEVAEANVQTVTLFMTPQ